MGCSGHHDRVLPQRGGGSPSVLCRRSLPGQAEEIPAGGWSYPDDEAGAGRETAQELRKLPAVGIFRALFRLFSHTAPKPFMACVLHHGMTEDGSVCDQLNQTD